MVLFSPQRMRFQFHGLVSCVFILKTNFSSVRVRNKIDESSFERNMRKILQYTVSKAEILGILLFIQLDTLCRLLEEEIILNLKGLRKLFGGATFEMRYHYNPFPLQKLRVALTSAKSVRVIHHFEVFSLQIISLDYEVVTVISVNMKK